MSRSVVIVVAVLCVVVAWVLIRTRKGRLDSRPKGEPYSRVEEPALRAFYKPYADYLDVTPPDIAELVNDLASDTGLPRHSATYPVDNETLRKTALALAKASSQRFGLRLAVDDPDPGQIDRLVNGHLLEPELRSFFEGESRRSDLGSDAEERYANLVDKHRLPNEPLLYYSLGAFWGEWLVRNRNARWVLFAPLNPVQSFPDMVTALDTICLHPFSQVVKKMTDPEGDQLVFKAHVATSGKKYFAPFPLIASLADAKPATRALLPELVTQGLDLQQRGQGKEAVGLFAQAIQESPNEARLYAFGISAAWTEGQWDLVERWSKGAIALAPDNPMLKHNLAVLYSGSPSQLPQAVSLLEAALRDDPGYARAHLTLASCLADKGDRALARKHAEWVIEHDPQLKTEAEGLLASLESP